MASKKPFRKSAPTSDEPAEPIWLTPAECRRRLGGITAQKWGRILREHDLPSREKLPGVILYDPDAVEDLAERLGVNDEPDPSAVAVTVLRETIESISSYVQELQKQILEAMTLLRAENDALRNLRGVEQKAYFDAMVAAQTALDMRSTREREDRAQQAKDERTSKVVNQLSDQVLPLLLQQWVGPSAGSAKLLEAVRSLKPEAIALARDGLLTPEQFEALSAALTPEQVEGVKALDAAIASKPEKAK